MEIKKRVSSIEEDLAKLGEERQLLNEKAGQMQKEMNEVDVQSLKKQGALEELREQLKEKK